MSWLWPGWMGLLTMIVGMSAMPSGPWWRRVAAFVAIAAYGRIQQAREQRLEKSFGKLSA